MTVSSCIHLKYLADSSGNLVPKFLWTNIEPDVGIICACLPTMMPLIRLVREKLGSKIYSPSVRSRALSPSTTQWPRNRKREPTLDTDRDDFAYLVDSTELPTATSWAWRGMLPEDEAARSTEEGLAMGRVHVRNDVNVSHDQI